MTALGWIVMLTIVAIGMIYTNYVARGMADKKNEGASTMELLEAQPPYNWACLLIFGPFVIVLRRILHKLFGGKW